MNAYSQNKHKIDSLLSLAQRSKQDSIKAYLYLQISNEYWSDNPVECKKYANMALTISKKINSHYLMSDAYKNMGSACTFDGKISEAIYFDRLGLKEAILSRDNKKISGNCVSFGLDLTTFSKFDSANIIFDLGIKIAKNNDDDQNLCSLYINKGNNLYYESKIDSAEKYYQAGLMISLSRKDTEHIVMLYNNIASIRLQRGISDSIVINYLMNAIFINERRKDSLQLGDNYATLASAYNSSNKVKTIYYLKKGIEVFGKNETKTVNLLASLADQFRELKLYDSAVFYADIAIARAERNHFKHGIAAAYSMKGIVLSDLLNYESAERFLLKAFLNYSEDKDGEGILLSGNYLASVLNKQKKYSEAISIATKVFHVADTLKNYNATKTASLTLSEIYHKIGNDSKAYEYQKYYMTASDTIEKVRNAHLLEEMTTKYETKKKDNEILLLNNDKLIKEKKIVQQSRRLFIIGFIVILLLLGFYFYIKLSKYKNEKAQFILKQQIAEVKQEALSAQMSSHFISNTMDSINNFIKNNEKDKASEYLLLFNRLIRRVLDHSFKKSITIKDDLEILKDYIELEKLRFKESPLEYEMFIGKEIDINNTMIPPMVFQVLTENSIKHGFSKLKGGKILLRIERKEDTIECVVEDNGMGRKESTVNQVDDLKRKSSHGTEIAEKLIRLFTDTGKDTKYKILDILDEMKNCKGTRVEFTIPLINND